MSFRLICQVFCCHLKIFVAPLLDLVPRVTLLKGKGGPDCYWVMGEVQMASLPDIAQVELYPQQD